MAGKKGQGGAVEETVSVSAPGRFHVDKGEKTIAVVTTSIGTDRNGLVPVGTEMEVPLSAYSTAWMQPLNAKEAKKVAE